MSVSECVSERTCLCLYASMCICEGGCLCLCVSVHVCMRESVCICVYVCKTEKREVPPSGFASLSESWLIQCSWCCCFSLPLSLLWRLHTCSPGLNFNRST